MEITIANPYKGRLETINVEFTDENTTFCWIEEEMEVSITDYNGCLIVRELRVGVYPAIIYGVSRADIGNDMSKALRLRDEKLDQWGELQPE